VGGKSEIIDKTSKERADISRNGLYFAQSYVQKRKKANFILLFGT